MPQPGRDTRKARASLRKESGAILESLRTEQGRAYAAVLHEACEQAGIDLTEIGKEARRRTLAATQPIIRRGRPPQERFADDFARASVELRDWLTEYLKASRDVYARFTGNPMLFMTVPESVDVIADVPVPGMSGGSGDIRDRAYATYACTYDLAGTANLDNVLHPYLLVDNRDDQHVETEGSLSLVLHFVSDPPPADWFLGERIWAPLLGHGVETYFPGWPSCSDHLPILNARGCLGHTMRYDIRITQDGNSWGDYDLADPSDPDLEYVRLRDRSYCGGTAEEGWLPTQEPISFPAINAFVYDAPGVLLKGVEQGGRSVHVDVTLTLHALTYYEGEYNSLDFRAPNWLSLPWVAIAGRHVHL